MVSTVRRGCRIKSRVRRQQLQMTTQNLAHAALDAIAFVRLAQHLAGCQPDARPSGICNCLGMPSSSSAEQETSSSRRTAACGCSRRRADNPHACTGATPSAIAGLLRRQAAAAWAVHGIAGRSSARNAKVLRVLPGPEQIRRCLVAISGADGHALAACGAAAAQYGGSALGLHAGAKAVRLHAARRFG